ncbi:putative Radical SAM domain protein [groundwater metagenome]|uniref:Putative Radical SAM domain protein n=1 Tax=groundwater metagenome TaxID=717931 RepID=A0A098E9G2_9ZZZZ
MATLILNSGRCTWGKCIFCGYGKIYKKRTNKDLLAILDDFFANLKDDSVVKIFGSGSFFDEKQISKEIFEYFIEKTKENKISKIYLESRPEFITKEKILCLKETNAEINIAIGLESASDKILKTINKGFKVKDFENVANLIHSLGCKVRVYLLVNLPAKNQKAELEKSVNFALNYADSIVLLNLLPHENSEIFDLWIKGEWNFLAKEEFFDWTSKWKNNPKIELDVETFKFVPRFRDMKILDGVGEEFLTHPYFEVWQDYLQRWYKKQAGKDIVLFLPCSAKKPYSESETHKKILNILSDLDKEKYESVHQVMISNPGVIPREFENFEPLNAYNWDEKSENEFIKKRYIEVTKERIKKYLLSQKYNKIFCFLKYTESYEALKLACEALNLNFKNLLKKETYEKMKKEGITSIVCEDALNDLRERIKEI